MPCHVDKNVTPLVGHEPLAAGGVLAPAVSHEPDEVFHCDFVAPVIHLDVVSIQIEGAVGIVEDGSRECIARVARHVIGQHENDLRVWYAEALDCTVQRQDVGEMAIVEPEARCPHEHRPVGRVLTCDERRCQEREEDAGNLHGGISAPCTVAGRNIRCAGNDSGAEPCP